MADVDPNTARFDWGDYTVFGLMLGCSALIGIYFGCFGKRQATVHEYILGGKTMKAVPVAWSLIATSVSGVSLIGVPSEVYTDNGSYWLVTPALVIATIFSYYWIIPIFTELDMPSTYQYLELRYDRSVRMLASWFNNTAFLLYLPAVVYIPSLTLSQVTGINLHYISAGVTAICVFYTLIGGLRAVIWSDFFQLTVMIVSTCTILILGTNNVGGLSGVLKTGYDDGKLDIFNFDPNPFQRNTFWTIFIGGLFFNVVAIGLNQGYVQRYLSLSSKNDLRKVFLIFLCGLVLMNTLNVYSGLVIYKAYYGCDPILQQIVHRPDQILPHFIMDRIGYVPILPGLFIAGIFSGALSTLSTALNTIAGVIYEDNMRRLGFGETMSQVIIKLIIVAIGVFSVVMVFVIENMGKVLSVVFIVTSVTATPVAVLFIMGMMVPISNKKGAMTGALSCALLLAWIATGATFAKVNFATKQVYPIDTCPSHVNSTINRIVSEEMNDIDDTFFLYQLSYMMYGAVGIMVGVTVGVITSYVTGPTDPAKVDPRLISPPLRRFLPEYVKKHDTPTQDTLAKLKEGLVFQ